MHSFAESKIATLKRDFANHVATIKDYKNDSGVIRALTWKAPKTWCMGINYVFSGSNVFVSGDLGCAAYWWPTQNNLHFFGGLNLDYFVSKCEASEYGRRPRKWDEQTAVEHINSRLDEFKEDYGEEYGEEYREAFAKYHPQLKVAAYYGQEDFERVVEDIYKSEEIFDDTEELGALCRCGEVYPVRIIAHWLGLKLAVAQLEAVGVA